MIKAQGSDLQYPCKPRGSPGGPGVHLTCMDPETLVILCVCVSEGVLRVCVCARYVVIIYMCASVYLRVYHCICIRIASPVHIMCEVHTG